MIKYISLPLFTLSFVISTAQSNKLTVEKIMRDPQWIGTSPSNPQWGADGQTLYFSWNPEKAPSDSLYFITKADHFPSKATGQQKADMLTDDDLEYNQLRTAVTY